MSNQNGAEVIKLTEPGSSLTVAVIDCAPMTVGTYPEIEFTGLDGDKLVAIRVPKSSADRQLKRGDLTYETAKGKVLTFSRDPSNDPNKPYWGITLVGDAPPQTPAQSADASVPNKAESVAATGTNGHKVNGDTREKLSAAYDAATKHVIEKVVPMYRGAKIEPTAQDIAAMTATLFIAATRNS